MIASVLAIENSAEIQIAKFATQHLRDEKTREFAQQLTREHQAMLEKLQQFGAAEANTLGGTTGRSDISVRAGQADVNVDVNRLSGENRREDRDDRSATRSSANTNTGANPNTSSNANGATGSHLDPIAIQREITQEYLRSAQQELETSDDADRCFVGAQVVVHQQMLAALKVFQRHASAPLAEALSQATTSTQQHLVHAKQLLKTLDQKPSAVTGANSPATNR